MANFLDAIDKVLEHEGGFVNNPLDTGGATNYGITQRVYGAYVGRKVSVDEMKNMPKGNAVAIYKKNYWDKIQGDKIKDYAVAFTLFDQAVNRGISGAVKQAQKILNITQDGVAGSGFVYALNAASPKTFLDQYLAASEQAYRNIVANNPSQATFLKGWLNRIGSLKKYASNFVGTPVGKASIGVGTIALLALGIFLFLNRKKN